MYVEYCSVCVSCRHVLYIYIYIYVEYCSVCVSCRHVFYIYIYVCMYVEYCSVGAILHLVGRLFPSLGVSVASGGVLSGARSS